MGGGVAEEEEKALMSVRRMRLPTWGWDGMRV